MQSFSFTADAVAATTKKNEKVRLVAEYFLSRPLEEAAQAAVFFSGRAFPAWEERTLQVGGVLLWRALGEISGKGEVALTAAYRRHGDLGAAAEDVLKEALLSPGTRNPGAPRSPLEEAAPRTNEATLTLAEVSAVFDELARTSSAAHKLRLLEDLLRRATALEAKYVIKIIGGDLRIGLRESLVEEAIARAFSEIAETSGEGRSARAASHRRSAIPAEERTIGGLERSDRNSTLAAVQRANMLLGDIGETLRLAARHQLDQARMRLFHPLGFMLASPAQDAAEAFSYFTRAAVEDKYDGIRAQAHAGGKEDRRVRLFSRTLDEISQSFPELPPALRALPDPVVLDGEVLAWSAESGQALPFSELQKRLGRKTVSEEMARSVPVIYMVFDVLYAGGELVIERPLEERRKLLEQIFAAVP